MELFSNSDDIMDYVLVRVPPPLSGLPRPRFSLYLSSQLQYGVVLVYHRQCEFLLGGLGPFVKNIQHILHITRMFFAVLTAYLSFKMTVG